MDRERAPQSSGRALIVEDEPRIRELVALHLSLEGLTSVEAGDGDEALRLARADRFALIVLDLMLPGLDGVTVCRAIRRDSPNAETPILMLTARSEESDKVLGLESGADDYLTKPFGTGELMARIRVALRRSGQADAAAEEVLEVGDIRVDQPRHEVTVAGKLVHLTPIEFKILVELARQPGRVLTHRQLGRAIWGAMPTEQSHTLRVHVAALRRKIEEDPARPRWLVTEAGVGYRLRDERSTG